jgi:predicted nucleotidyltransferase component of viral defense system
MIQREEILEKSKEFGISPNNVQRDYLFGWLLHGIYNKSDLSNHFILKGGNCFRKAYFESTRYSNDLDFSVLSELSKEKIGSELALVCQSIQEATGIVFEIEKTKIESKRGFEPSQQILEAKVYFKDFFGNSDRFSISSKLDITQFDKIYLPIQDRNLIHPYSDRESCPAKLKCWKMEEMLGSKLKCLLQRRHIADFFDLIYSVFINQELAVDKSEIISTFLKRTIFSPSPTVAKSLLLDLPFGYFKEVWKKYIVCPRRSEFEFENGLSHFQTLMSDLFASFSPNRSSLAFFPSKFRTPIMEAGQSQTLLNVVYDGIERPIEPYALLFKTRKDGHSEEYWWVYDRKGGATSGPNFKWFVNSKVSSIENTDVKFEPQQEILLSKSGEAPESPYFSNTQDRRFGIIRRPSIARRSRTSRSIYGISRPKNKSGWIYIFQCNYCEKKFRRTKNDSGLNEHKDKYGNKCYGRRGYLIDQKYEY